MKKVLLYSGGMDSWLIDKLWKPDIKLYVNMHTKYSDIELKHLPDDVKVVDFKLGQWEREDNIIPLRNLYLVMVACNITGSDDVEICLGATAGDRVLDKSEEFVTKATDLLNYLYTPQWWLPKGKKVRVNIDFKKYDKSQLLKMYLDSGGDIEAAFLQSFSCYCPDKNNKECWACKPCFRKFVAFENCGYRFSKSVLCKVIPYIKQEIVPQINHGTYGRGANEETSILRAVSKYENNCL